MRSTIPVVHDKLFFNTGWSGPSPLPVVEEQKRMLEWLSAEGLSHHTYQRLHKNIERLRARVAKFFGVRPGEITLTRSTTEAINIVLGGIDWRPGSKIVTTNIEHGAGLIPVYNVRDRYGVDVEIVDLASSANPVGAIARAIDERTRMVVVSHVSFNTGIRIPLQELSQVVASRSAELLVDGAQAAGVFSIDLRESGCDYYAFPGHKWLLGPDAVGGLYVKREKLPALKISFAGNESVKKYDREGGATYQSSAKKFEYSDFNGALVAGWLKAFDVLDEFGMESIEAAIRTNTNYLKRRLARLKNVSVITPLNWQKSAGLVSIEMKGKKSEDAFHELLGLGIIARFTPPPSYIRFSVNYFNTRTDLDRLLAAVRQVSNS